MACSLEALFRSHYEPLCALTGRYVSCPDGAGDVVQDVFTRLWERPALWHGCKDSRRFLYVAARNRALQHQAHNQFVEGHFEYGSFQRNEVTIPTAEIVVRDLVLLGGPRRQNGLAPDEREDLP